MTVDCRSFPYSFSMINTLGIMPEWSWHSFDEIMIQAETNSVELVPSVLLGSDWDLHFCDHTEPCDSLLLLSSKYTVKTIQSLMHGLNVSLADCLCDSVEVTRRFRSLTRLADILNCKILILGSPGLKRINNFDEDVCMVKSRFIDNCAWIASSIAPNCILSLEHNTLMQGAQFCNTLADVVDVVQVLRSNGVCNVGLNIDTKCLIHEYGCYFGIADLERKYRLADVTTSIQLSFDFLLLQRAKESIDVEPLLRIANSSSCSISLEEFGLMRHQLPQFVGAWKSIENSRYVADVPPGFK